MLGFVSSIGAMKPGRQVLTLFLSVLFCLSTVQLNWLVSESSSALSKTKNSVCPFHGDNCCCLEMCRSSKASHRESCHFKTGFTSNDFDAFQPAPARCFLNSGCQTTKALVVSGLTNFLPASNTPPALDTGSSYLTSVFQEFPLSGDLPTPFRPPPHSQVTS
jgi:hypothetical protein